MSKPSTQPSDTELLDWLETIPNLSLYVGAGAMVEFTLKGRTECFGGASVRRVLVLAMQETER